MTDYTYAYCIYTVYPNSVHQPGTSMAWPKVLCLGLVSCLSWVLIRSMGDLLSLLCLVAIWLGKMMIIWHSIFRQTIGVRCVLDPHMFFGMFFLPRDSEVMQTICSPLGPQCTKAIWSWCCFAWVHTGEGYGGYGCAFCEIYSVTDFDDFQVQPWGDTIHTWWCWVTCSGTDQKTEVGFVVDYQHQFSMFLFIFDAVDYFTFFFLSFH